MVRPIARQELGDLLVKLRAMIVLSDAIAIHRNVPLVALALPVLERQHKGYPHVLLVHQESTNYQGSVKIV